MIKFTKKGVCGVLGVGVTLVSLFSLGRLAASEYYHDDNVAQYDVQSCFQGNKSDLCRELEYKDADEDINFQKRQTDIAWTTLLSGSLGLLLIILAQSSEPHCSPSTKTKHQLKS